MQVQVLQEGSRSNEIGYHFTDLSALAQILKSDCLFATNDEVETHSKVPTWSYTRRKEGFVYRNLNNPSSVRITLDIDKISNNFKVLPYSFVDMAKNDKNFEYEERVLGEPVKVSGKQVHFRGEPAYGLMQVHKYITEITLNSFLEKAMSSREYMTVDPDIIVQVLDYYDQFEELNDVLYDISKILSVLIQNKSFVIQSGSVSDILKWLKYSFNRFKVPDTISENSKLDYYLKNELPDILEMHSRYFKLLSEFCIRYDRSILHDKRGTDLGLFDFKAKLEEMNSSGDLILPVSDKERKDNSDFTVSEFVRSLSVLKTKDGHSVTDLEELRDYLKGYGIKLNFSSGYNDTNARYVYKEEFRSIFNKLKKRIDNYLSDLSSFKSKFTEFKNQLGIDYRLVRRNLSKKVFRPEFEKALREFINELGQSLFSDYFISELNVRASDRIYLTGFKNMESVLTPVFYISDSADSIKPVNFSDLYLKGILKDVIKFLGYSSHVNSVSVKDFLSRFCKVSQEFNGSDLIGCKFLLTTERNRKVKKYFLGFRDVLIFFTDNRPIIPIMSTDRLSSILK